MLAAELQVATKKECKVCMVVGERGMPGGLASGQVAVMEDWVLDVAATQTRPTVSRDYLPV